MLNEAIFVDGHRALHSSHCETLQKLTMKIFLSIQFLSMIFQSTNCVTYLRPKNDRGPGSACFKCLTLQKILRSTLVHFEGAMQSGVDCIEHVERFFFKNEFSQQVQNIAVFHSKSMSSPAMEIEVEYLYGLHDRIMHQEEDEDTFQLKVISDRVVKESVNSDSFRDHALTDFYVIVADNIDSVSKHFNI